MSAAAFDFDQISNPSLRVNGTNGHTQIEPQGEQPGSVAATPFLWIDPGHYSAA